METGVDSAIVGVRDQHDLEIDPAAAIRVGGGARPRFTNWECTYRDEVVVLPSVLVPHADINLSPFPTAERQQLLPGGVLEIFFDARVFGDSDVIVIPDCHHFHVRISSSIEYETIQFLEVEGVFNIHHQCALNARDTRTAARVPSETLQHNKVIMNAVLQYCPAIVKHFTNQWLTEVSESLKLDG